METKFTLRNLLFTTLIILAITSCSSDKKEGDATSSDVAEATADASMGDPSMDPAAADSGAAGDMAAQDPLADPNASPDTQPQDMAAADKPEDALADPNAQPQDMAANTDPNAAANPANPGDLPPADPLADSTTPPPSTDAAPTSPTPPPEIAQGDAGAPPADQSSSGDLFGSSAATTGAADAAPAPTEEKPKKSLPLAHLKDAPFKKGGQLLNTAYIAREGDTLESVSDKIFGENKVAMLKKANPSLKKGLKAGDKIYFNSPNRPEDSEKMMTVYEDQGLPPTTYTTKEGDTLKSLAMEWYGSEASYKEIYAINRGLASTKELPAGTELQYWPASVSIVAYNNKGSNVAEAMPPEAPAPAATTAPPAPNLPPPAAAANTAPAPGMEAANTLPPPPDLNAPPLPPPPSVMKKKSSAVDAMDNDTKMYVALAGALLVGGVAIAALRKRGNKRNQGVTQI